MTDETAASRERLVQDLKLVISDAEELLRASASQAGEKVAAVRERVEQDLRRAKERLARVEETVADRSREAARAADEFVHDHPWQAVGMAAGLGLVIGLLIGRR